MQKKWMIKDSPNPIDINHLQKEMGVSRIVAEMLVQRGITTFDDARLFFRPSLEDLHDPFLMKDMEKAVNRVQLAMENNEKVLIYGDYDVDGTTAVALFFDFLKQKHANTAYYIPDRYEEGYGISEQGVIYAQENGFSLIVTLDCGIKANDKVVLGKKAGIDFIVCDHHTPGKELPDGIVLDPKRIDCQYPYKELSGCGVGFKLLSALSQKMNWDMEELYEYLDLLAISIAADIVPITGENRILCSFGLDKLNKNPRKGIHQLLKLAQKPLPLTLTNVVFIIAPRINAAGRMGDAKDAVQLLVSKEQTEIKTLATNIHQANEARREVDEKITNEALQQLEEDSAHKQRCTNIVFKSGWHKGVIGIVASRIIETHYRPTVVLTQQEEGGLLTASLRSVKGVNIYDILENCSDLLEQFGGHYYAAGLSLKVEHLNSFKQRFEEEVQKVIDEETLIPEQILERELDFDEIFVLGEPLYEVPRLKRILSQFEPHGPGNMKPVFISKNVYAKDARLLKEKHLKVKLHQPNNRPFIDAILFNRPDAYELATSGEPLDVVYTLEVNEWQGKTTLQLNLKDMRYTMVVAEE